MVPVSSMILSANTVSKSKLIGECFLLAVVIYISIAGYAYSRYVLGNSIYSSDMDTHYKTNNQSKNNNKNATIL